MFEKVLFSLPAAATGGAATAVTLGDAFLAVSTLIGGAGNIMQGNAQRAAGEAAANQAAYQAQLMDSQAKANEIAAGQERAASQRAAAEQLRRGRLVASRARAVGAASGGGSLDPTMMDILSGIESEAGYRSSLALYQGEDAARSLEYGAVLNRARGAGEIYAGQSYRNLAGSAANRSYLGAGGALVSGGAGLSERFERRRPQNTILSQGSGLGRYADQIDQGYYGYS